MLTLPNTPIALEGGHVKLIPLTIEHCASFKSLLLTQSLHKLWYTHIPSAERVEDEIKRRLALQSIGSMIPFSVLDRANNQICGMTSFMNIDAKNRRVEIGSTWLSMSVQRSAINTQMKYLQSKKAIERLGAKLDGVLRSHQIMPNKSLRDTCVYSITHAEWPAVKAHLTHLQNLYTDSSFAS